MLVHLHFSQVKDGTTEEISLLGEVGLLNGRI
jgi:hypothetical protein